MIHPDSRTYDWINNVAISNGVKNKSLAEKTIRAFSLLEALVRSGCPLIFKGGTSLMLHLNSAKRLSIDVDIICPPGTPIENFLYEHAEEYGFGKVELLDRKTRLEIPKKHAKYHYQVAYPSGHEEDKILLDVLFEDNHYSEIVSLPIQSPFLKMEGDSVFVKIPSHEDLLGDKLTAFAPHTTGIPFFKGEKDCSMEINKQLFDIASLFDLTNDISVSMQTFKKFADIELQYRNKEDLTINDVLKDIFNTSRCISLRGVEAPDEFKLLQQGINKVKSFIHSENYSIESAIVNSAKAAYLSKLIELGITEVNHFDPSKVHELYNANIVHPLLSSKFNKFKKSNIEAFYYWNEIQKLL
ncbi:MAG: nucleotidyl transferase AbiEii/AbiGii toxin family protein [Muribaculaceae bacterium]|nr:nucleotidyl transferase AbiEii/AbiGii toxin family protein [Muribaculaceae bacterium]